LWGGIAWRAGTLQFASTDMPTSAEATSKINLPLICPDFHQNMFDL
jgi:hypothetical protein